MGKKENKNLLILKELNDTLTNINIENTVISPWTLINNINKLFSFAYEQQDSYELYHRLIELFEVSEEYSKHNPFRIGWETSYECTSCHNVIKKTEHTLDLSCSPSITNVLYIPYSV